MRLAIALVVGLSLAFPTSASADNLGEIRTLVIRATHGPTPFSDDQVRDVVFGEASAWIRDASYGRTWLAGTVTPWLRAFSAPTSCFGQLTGSGYLEAISRTALPAARAAGYDPAAYERIVYLVAWRCPDFTGIGVRNQIGLFGTLTVDLLVHELGHTFGILGHAYSLECYSSCEVSEYGDPYDVMGHGVGQYNAWEKFRIGWLTNVARPRVAGRFVVDQLERPSILPQAFVVTTARNQYWFEHREPVLQDSFLAGSPLVEGLFVRAGRTDHPRVASDYPLQNILLRNPGRRGHDALLPGDTFRERGAFEVTVLRHVETRVELQFRWTDGSRPSRPRRTAVSRSGRQLRITWAPSRDRGSGVERYDVILDRRRFASIPIRYGTRRRASVRTTRGTHVVSVFAVDRAGNRSPAARQRVRVP